MKSFYFLLYLPAVIFFLLPVVNILYQSAKINRAAKASEEKRRRAAEIKAIETAAKQAAKERAAEIKWAEKEMVSPGKKRPGRPRKNPPVELPENILNIQDAEASAPVRTGDAPDRLSAYTSPVNTLPWWKRQSKKSMTALSPGATVCNGAFTK